MSVFVTHHIPPSPPPIQAAREKEEAAALSEIDGITAVVGSLSEQAAADRKVLSDTQDEAQATRDAHAKEIRELQGRNTGCAYRDIILL